MIRKIAEMLVKHRFAAFIFSLSMIFVMSAGIKNMKFSADYRIFFSQSDPYFQAFEELERKYTSSVSVVLVVASHDGDIYTQQNLKAIKWLTERGWKVPLSTRVDSLSNFQHTYSVGDELVVQDLLPSSMELSEANIEKIRDFAQSESSVVNRLVSKDGKAASIIVTITLPKDRDPTLSFQDVIEGPGGVNEIVASFKDLYPAIDIKITGIVGNNYAFKQVAMKDMVVLMPVLVLVIIALIGILTKSIFNTVITLVIMSFSVVATIGSVSHFGLLINNISGIAPMIIMTLAIAECVHLLCYYSERLREGFSQVEAMTKSLENNLIAIFLTSFTTTVGFLGMNTSDSPPYVELGNISALGITLAYILCHVMLPQLAIWFSKPAGVSERVKPAQFNRAVVNFVLKNYKPVFYWTLLISLLFSGFAFLNVLNDDNIGYFKKGVDIRDATDFAEAEGFPIGVLEYSLESGREGGINDVNYLQKVDRFVEWLRTQPEVTNVHSYVHILKTINKSMNENRNEEFKIPQSNELASQYSLLYEMSLPMGMDINNFVDTKKSSLRIVAQVPMMKAKKNIALDERIQDWLKSNYPEIHYVSSSPMLMFAHVGQRNIDSMILGTVTSTAIICLCMIIGLGSIRIGMMALLPNIFPSTIMLGLWGLFVGEVNLGVAIVFTVTTGIIVDDTIHLFAKYAEGIRKGMTTEDAIRYSFDHVGKGVVVTTAVLCSGFAVLMFSNFMINVTLGVMVSLTIAIALMFDVIFMPSVLMMFRSAKENVVEDYSKALT